MKLFHAGTAFGRLQPILGFLGVALLVGVGVTGLAPHRARAIEKADHPAGCPMDGMSEAQIQQKFDQLFARFPIRGVFKTAAQAVTTIIATDGEFDADGNSATEYDTVSIYLGDVVMWQWGGIGTHTVTSGQNVGDPEAGALFNVPLSSSSPQFSYEFTSVGMVPFFCLVDGDGTMGGAVRVLPVAGVTPIGEASGRIGFVGSPAPNPSHGAIAFRFALTQRGHVRGTVFDAAGRSVASVIDRDLEPGAYAASWDGRDRAGSIASAGVYWLRLSGPRFEQSRRVVLER